MLAAEALNVHPQSSFYSAAGSAHLGRGSQTQVTRNSVDHLEILNWRKVKWLRENRRLLLSERGSNALLLKGIYVKEEVGRWGKVLREQES